MMKQFSLGCGCDRSDRTPFLMGNRNKNSIIYSPGEVATYFHIFQVAPIAAPIPARRLTKTPSKVVETGSWVKHWLLGSTANKQPFK